MVREELFELREREHSVEAVPELARRRGVRVEPGRDDDRTDREGDRITRRRTKAHAELADAALLLDELGRKIEDDVFPSADLLEKPVDQRPPVLVVGEERTPTDDLATGLLGLLDQVDGDAEVRKREGGPEAGDPGPDDQDLGDRLDPHALEGGRERGLRDPGPDELQGLLGRGGSVVGMGP